MQAANELLFVGALLFVAAVLVSAWAFRVGAPLLLVFLVVGMLAGEEGPGAGLCHRARRRRLLQSVADIR